MATSWRSSALWLAVIAGCSGQKFKAAEQLADDPKGGSGAAATGGRGTTGGSSAASAAGEAAEHAGSANEPSSGGQGGGGDSGDDGGAGGGDPTCDAPCGQGEQCTATPTGPACRCPDGQVGADEKCRLPLSCDELHRYAPSLPSAAYSLKPKGAASSFQAYCGMMQEGGGWTLVVNEGPDFDPTTQGAADAVCYSSSCTSIGYSLVPLESDVMLDISNSAIAGSTYTARLIANGVHALSRGKTLRTLFTTGPNYVEAENNSNLTVRMRDGAACETLPQDLAKLACSSCDTVGCKVPVMVFGDNDAQTACAPGAVPRFAIGAAEDYVNPWYNCAGWPQHPAYSDTSFYPSYVRVWVR